MTPQEALVEAGRKAGSLRKLAQKLAISPQAIYQWGQVPADRVLDVEAAAGGAVSRYDLRPDIYGTPEEAA